MDDMLIGDITCPHCQQKAPFTYHPFVDGAKDPELKQKCMTGEIFGFTCPHCNHKARIGYPLAYHDAANRTLILAYPERNPAEAHQLLEALADKGGVAFPGCRLRVAAQPPMLAEKIFLLDQALDDRIIELYKLMLRPSIQRDNGSKAVQLIMLCDHESTLQFLFLLEGLPLPMFVPFDADMYDAMCKEYAAFFSNDAKENLYIDQQWAEEFLKPSGMLQ